MSENITSIVKAVIAFNKECKKHDAQVKIDKRTDGRFRAEVIVFDTKYRDAVAVAFYKCVILEENENAESEVLCILTILADIQKREKESCDDTL